MAGVGAEFGCGATTFATQDFVGLVWVLNLVVVPALLRRGNLRDWCGC